MSDTPETEEIEDVELEETSGLQEMAGQEVSTEVKQTAPAVLVHDAGNASFLAVIERIASNPDLSVEKMQAIMDMQERQMAKQAEINFNEALARLQPMLPHVEKKGMIKFTDKNGVERNTPHARYEDIDEAIRPHLAVEGFSLSFNTEWGDQGVTAFGTLSHKDGHSRTAEMRLPLDTSGSKNNLQAMGSTITYAKRYLVGMLLNIVTMYQDTDGSLPIPIDEKEIKQIRELLKKGRFQEASFCKAFEIEKLENLNKEQLKTAMVQLKNKVKSQEKEKAERAAKKAAVEKTEPSCTTCGGKGFVDKDDSREPCTACDGKADK